MRTLLSRPHNGHMDEKGLLAAIYEFAPTNDPYEALAIGAAEWSGMESRPANPEDAESCRLLMVSAAGLQEFNLARVWRSRARSIGERIPWPEMIAALNMSEAFAALSIRNDDYSRGRTLDLIEGSPEAVEIIQALANIAEGPGTGIHVTPRSPTIQLIRRFLFEKAGSFQLALGDDDSAAESFRQAAAAAEGPRGSMKTHGGLAIANYRRGLGSDDETAVEQAFRDTRDIERRADDAGETDVAATAAHNGAVMGRRGQDLLLYEIL